MTDTGLAYAGLDDLQASLSREEEDERVLDSMSQALLFGADRINQELEADFFRHPSTGTETWLVEGKGGSVLHVHRGIVAITLLRIRFSRLSTWQTLAASDYDLEAWADENPSQALATTFPFDHVRLTGAAGIAQWPKGPRLIEFTGARGWPGPPEKAVDANVAMARQIMAADRTFPGGIETPDEFGRPVLPSRLPDAVYRLKIWHSNLYAACST